MSDNYYKKLIKRETINNESMGNNISYHMVFQRGNVIKLKLHKDFLIMHLNLQLRGDYWKAMNLNGILINSVLYNNYYPLLYAIENNCLAVSYSGNGPAIAAVVHKDNIENLKNSFANLKGRMIVSQVNNSKAFVI